MNKSETLTIDDIFCRKVNMVRRHDIDSFSDDMSLAVMNIRALYEKNKPFALNWLQNSYKKAYRQSIATQAVSDLHHIARKEGELLAQDFDDRLLELSNQISRYRNRKTEKTKADALSMILVLLASMEVSIVNER